MNSFSIPHAPECHGTSFHFDDGNLCLYTRDRNCDITRTEHYALTPALIDKLKMVEDIIPDYDLARVALLAEAAGYWTSEEADIGMTMKQVHLLGQRGF